MRTQSLGLGRSPQDLAAIIGEARDPKTIVEKAKPLGEHGGDRKSEEIQGTGSTLKVRGSTKEYRTARLARVMETTAMARFRNQGSAGTVVFIIGGSVHKHQKVSQG